MYPYIGITGFSRTEEVSTALQAFPNNDNRKLMVGVLATYKSLRGLPMKSRWAKQTPKARNIRKLFFNDERVVNLVHFSTDEGQENSILTDMFKIHDLAGPNFHGFQLNIAWPEIHQLDDYRATMGWNYRIILQLGQKAIGAAGGTVKGVVETLHHYVGVVDDILFDPSGGLGKPFNTEEAFNFLSAIAEQSWNIGLGVAGGLGPDSLDLINLLVRDFPSLNIDAQGRLRDVENDLNLNLVSAYLTKALKLFDR